MTNKTRVRTYKRAGKIVRSHSRRAKKKLDHSLAGRKDGVMLDTSRGNVGLDLDGSVYEQIEKGIDTPINILKKHGLSKEKVMYLVQSQKFDEKGQITIRNRRSNKTMKVKLFDFMYGNYGYRPSGVEPLSEELVK